MFEGVLALALVICFGGTVGLGTSVVAGCLLAMGLYGALADVVPVQTNSASDYSRVSLFGGAGWGSPEEELRAQYLCCWEPRYQAVVVGAAPNKSRWLKSEYVFYLILSACCFLSFCSPIGMSITAGLGFCLIRFVLGYRWRFGTLFVSAVLSLLFGFFVDFTASITLMPVTILSGFFRGTERG